MKRLCVLVVSALSVANVNNSQAMNMKKCNVQKFQYINNNFSNMFMLENEINNTYDNCPEPGRNSLIQRSKYNESENEDSTDKYENLIFEQVDNFEINSNDDDEIIYNDDYNKVGNDVIVSRDNGIDMEGYCPEPNKPEFTKEELEERLKLSEEQSIVGQGDIKNRIGFPFYNFNINQSAINNKFLPEYSSPNEIIYENNFGNNASMQNNTNLSNYAQVIRIPHTEEDAYVKCFEMTSKNFKEQLEKYNKNKYDRTVDDMVALGSNPDFEVGYYSINLSEFPNPISVCFVARVYSNRNGSWKNYVFKNHGEITRNLSNFGNNTNWIIQNEINHLARYESKSFITFDIDKKHGINQANLTDGFALVNKIN